MATLKIRFYPDPVLLKKASIVAAILPEHALLVEHMIETMYCVAGVGLAAPQVGVGERIIVVNCDKLLVQQYKMDVSEAKKLAALGDKALVFVNPVIRKKKGAAICEEGCLSLPGIGATVSRYRVIVVEGLNLKGEKISFPAEDMFARILQHEIDHLNGILFPERTGVFKKKKLFKEFLKKKANR